MNVPAVSSVLEMRKRGVWEAVDSGILLWRNNFFYFIPVFAAPFLVTAFLLFLPPGQFRWISPFALWWLKPFFDRLCLHVVSSGFFKFNFEGGANANPENTRASGFRNIRRGLFGNLFPFLLGDLLWRRFRPLRAAAMPLRILEKPGRKQYAERKNILSRGGLDFCAFLSCFGIVAEIVLLGGELIFASTIMKIFFPFVSWNIRANSEEIFLVVYCAYCFNYILVESLYVCMGFGLYINSRTEVEGWDIELLFRKFSGKIAGAAGKSVVALLICFIFFVSAPFAGADDAANADSVNAAPGAEEQNGGTESEHNYFPPDFMPLESMPAEKLEEILSSDEFGGSRPGWTIRLKKTDKDRETRVLPQIDLTPWLKTLKEILAHGLRIIIILIIVSFIVFAIIRIRRFRYSGGLNSKGKTKTCANPFNSKESPEFFFETAESFFRGRLYKEAWAACLCGVIAAFENYLDISFPPDTTEYGCLALVRSGFAVKNEKPANEINTKIIEGFEALIRNWVPLAYGGRMPPEGSFEKVLEYGRSIKSKTAGGASIA